MTSVSLPIDFTHRTAPEDLPELMDEPCSYEDFRACLADLAQVNRLTLAHRPTLQFLERLIEARPSSQPLRIVDVGCGGGDMLRHIAVWAKRRGVQVALTGIDLNPYAAQAAREFSGKDRSNQWDIEWVTGDAFSYAPPDGVDVVLSSLFTHHLPEPEIVRFLTWMESTAQLGWFVNDLCRERTPHRLFQLLAGVMRWHYFVRYDGPVSIRRSFREEDWQRMIAAAGIDPTALGIARCFPARLCVGRLK
ncbi:methyltransferase domain-containing protein [Granulicella mallensis]|uniref:SAM-dependent methyltransferase n=1 Tax=Granulicella mallensis TaxID=940614 RepID=A0A7W7ZTT2_9BACT|nr:methyltransferase domain-containing protein [Granulicella mallensis]MBB5065961.1 SAM-dependent methyltransferase [Granulicella mallensis]